ncbi:MAG: HesA/MoeB/ThiF family protein [Muribaculaceae bacterium]|nr:HesA/MoeB/ThiF family protein [Muribaculaceae bacterium]
MTDSGRYSRQTMLTEIGEAGQWKISGVSVLIVGLGGLGAPVAIYLAGAGVGRLGLCDPDTVSESNLQRQVLYDGATIGHPKVVIAARRISALNPDVTTELHDAGLTPGNAADIISRYDYVVDCCDNFATRYLIDDTCAALGKTWVYGSIGEFTGQVAVINGSSATRYSTLYPDREALCSRPSRVRGVLGPVPGVVGAIEASETLKLITGAGEPLDGKLFTIDLLTMTTNLIYF